MSNASCDGGPVLLVDGTSLVYRAFFAISGLTAPDGRPTNAVYGFTNMLLRLLEDSECEAIVVAFDRGAPQYRLDIYPDYKGHRPEMPEELRPQFDMVREVLDGLGVPRIEIDGVEADDILGTLARQVSEAGRRAILVSGDKDLLQLISDRTEVHLTRRGITQMETYDLARIREEYGVEPPMLIDVKGLMGDSSDNIPGVPGIGEKTALKLVKNIGGLEAVLADPDRAGGKAVPKRLREHAEDARMSRILAEIHTDIPLDFDLESLAPPEMDESDLAKTLGQLGFTALLERLGVETSPETLPGVDLGAVEPSTWSEGLPGEFAEGDVAVDWRPDGEGLAYLAVSADPESGVLLRPEPGAMRAALEQLFSGEGRRVVGCDLGELLAWAGVREPVADLLDLQLAAYLLDPSRSSYPLESLAATYLETALPPDSEPEEARIGARLAAVALLGPALEGELAAAGLKDPLFDEIETPLIPILARMRIDGIAVDPDTLREQGESIEERIEAVQGDIWEIVGREFNVSSSKQLGEVLFEEMGLPVIRKTKTGYSADAEVLGQLSVDYPVAGMVLEYRSLVKLRGYVSGLLGEIDPETGRIHTTFHQVVAATGRLSSSDPNLQNIPIREETGRRLRRAFVAPEDHVLLAADYSQIELRILAHLSEDETLTDAFNRGEDIHRRTASEVFGVPMDEVDGRLRNAAKEVNFGIIYGISGFGLARSLKIDPAEAQEYIDGYLERMPGVQRYMEDVVVEARERGYVRTMFGRIRYLPDLHHRVYHRRMFAERMALNTPIQGAAADIIKKAMVQLEGDRYAPVVEGARLLLQVHDELIWEVPREGAEDLARRARRIMEAATDLLVPLQVDLKSGSNWYDMQPMEVSRDDA